LKIKNQPKLSLRYKKKTKQQQQQQQQTNEW
jgi:hypothetical protein